mgnify:CR=1 FL=1
MLSFAVQAEPSHIPFFFFSSPVPFEYFKAHAGGEKRDCSVSAGFLPVWALLPLSLLFFEAFRLDIVISENARGRTPRGGWKS